MAWNAAALPLGIATHPFFFCPTGLLLPALRLLPLTFLIASLLFGPPLLGLERALLPLPFLLTPRRVAGGLLFAETV